MKNHFCIHHVTGEGGTVVSGPLFVAGKAEPTVCNVIWDDGQHCTEKITDIWVSDKVNPKPPKW